jgi:hypothetical protein
MDSERIVLVYIRLLVLKLITENRRELNSETHLAFTDYEKSFGKVKKYILIYYRKKYNKRRITVHNIYTKISQ